MDIIELLYAIREKILLDIADPNKNRWFNKGEWVYTTPINVSFTNFPNIHIEELDAPRIALGTNTTQREIEATANLSFVYRLQDEWDVDGDGKTERPEQALNLLVRQVEDLINDNQELWRQTTGVWDVHTTNTIRAPTGNSSLIRKNLEIRVRGNT